MFAEKVRPVSHVKEEEEDWKRNSCEVFHFGSILLPLFLIEMKNNGELTQLEKNEKDTDWKKIHQFNLKLKTNKSSFFSF